MYACEILIIGAGAAGLSAAIGAVHAGAKSVLLADSADRIGGILPQCLHSGFGRAVFGEELTGPDFLERLTALLPEQVRICTQTTVLRIGADRTAVMSSPEGLSAVRFKELILATGCTEASIWATGTTGSRPAGVLTAGLAQQLVNLYGVVPGKGKRIVIVGSGDVGLVMAGRYAELGTKPLVIIEKEPQPGGLLRNRKRYVQAYDIPVMCRSVVEKIHGDKTLKGITIRHLSDDTTEYLPCDVLITALGLIPDRSLLGTLQKDGQFPDWVQLAGNCDYVHDLADTVYRNAKRVGEKAAVRCIKRR